MKAANDPTDILDKLPEPYRTMAASMPAELRAHLVKSMPDSIRAKIEAESEPEVRRAILVKIAESQRAKGDSRAPTAARVVLRKKGDASYAYSVEVEQLDGMDAPAWQALVSMDFLTDGCDPLVRGQMDKYGIVVSALAERIVHLEDVIARADADGDA